jgi:peptidoglycan/LPS O-acetylase OafA/YrhL
MMGILYRLWASRESNNHVVAMLGSFTGFEAIAMGAVLALILEEHGTSHQRGRYGELEIALGALGGGMMAGAYLGSDLDVPIDRVWGPTVMALGTVLVLGVGIRRSWGASRLFAAIFNLGQLSYAAYLAHAMVLALTWRFLLNRQAPIVFVIFAIATLTLSAFLHVAYERPLNRWIRERLRGHKS